MIIHKLFGEIELFDLVLSRIDNNSRMKCLCVCKTWNHIFTRRIVIKTVRDYNRGLTWVLWRPLNLTRVLVCGYERQFTPRLFTTFCVLVKNGVIYGRPLSSYIYDLYALVIRLQLRDFLRRLLHIFAGSVTYADIYSYEYVQQCPRAIFSSSDNARTLMHILGDSDISISRGSTRSIYWMIYGSKLPSCPRIWGKILRKMIARDIPDCAVSIIWGFKYSEKKLAKVLYKYANTTAARVVLQQIYARVGVVLNGVAIGARVYHDIPDLFEWIWNALGWRGRRRLARRVDHVILLSRLGGGEADAC